jgi:hypothetical protein
VRPSTRKVPSAVVATVPQFHTFSAEPQARGDRGRWLEYRPTRMIQTSPKPSQKLYWNSLPFFTRPMETMIQYQRSEIKITQFLCLFRLFHENCRHSKTMCYATGRSNGSVLELYSVCCISASGRITINLLRATGAWGWQPHRHLWADCLENVGAWTSHNPMDLHGLLRARFYRSVITVLNALFLLSCIYSSTTCFCLTRPSSGVGTLTKIFTLWCY